MSRAQKRQKHTHKQQTQTHTHTHKLVAGWHATAEHRHNTRAAEQRAQAAGKGAGQNVRENEWKEAGVLFFPFRDGNQNTPIEEAEELQKKKLDYG
jgi:hypothetical protein